MKHFSLALLALATDRSFPCVAAERIQAPDADDLVDSIGIIGGTTVLESLRK